VSARRIVLDTDMGSDVDDALCLALALASPELEIVAVTHVGAEPRLRAQVTQKLLSLAGRKGIPVFAGCRVPVLGAGFGVGSHEGVGILEPGEDPEIEPEHAVDALLRLTREHSGLDLVAVGPLTNLAVALMKDPDLAGRAGSLTVMGGHLRRVAYGGHVFAPGVDYNLCSDPHAAYVVLRSGMQTTLVTADVTLETPIGEREIGALERSGTPLHTALARAARIWAPLWKPAWARLGCDVHDDHLAFLHDPLALSSLYDAPWLGFETLEIEPAIEDVFRTHERPAPTERSFPMRCATQVDADLFREHWLERVLSLH
jgi:purine nucleosidase